MTRKQKKKFVREIFDKQIEWDGFGLAFACERTRENWENCYGSSKQLM